MPRVLIGPTKTDIHNNEYGKSYNLLNNLYDDNFTVDIYTRSVSDTLRPENVTVYPLGGSNRISFYSYLYYRLLRELREGSVDIYHHMNLSYRCSIQSSFQSFMTMFLSSLDRAKQGMPSC